MAVNCACYPNVCLSVCLSVCTVGSLCTYEEGPSSASTREDCSTTFADYFATLQQVCRAGQPGVLQWTPDMNTPDTVYYQVGGWVGVGVGVMWVLVSVCWCGWMCWLTGSWIWTRSMWKVNKAACIHFPCSVPPMSIWDGRSMFMIHLLEVLFCVLTITVLFCRQHVRGVSITRSTYIRDKGLQLHVNYAIMCHMLGAGHGIIFIFIPNHVIKWHHAHTTAEPCPEECSHKFCRKRPNVVCSL